MVGSLTAVALGGRLLRVFTDVMSGWWLVQDGVVRYESLDCVREHESWRMRAEIPLLALGMSNSPALRVKRRTALVWMVAFMCDPVHTSTP